MIHILGPRDRKPAPELRVINTTSRGGLWSGLSPFLIGPCKLYDGHISRNMENAWQFSKVYCVDSFLRWDADQHIGPSNLYFRWAETGWANPRAVRYPMGKGAKPLYSWWNEEALSYIEARKVIYIPLYRKAVESTKAFEALQNLYEKEGEIGLWDFDGYPQEGRPFKQIINDPFKKMGHAFVLSMMLQDVNIEKLISI